MKKMLLSAAVAALSLSAWAGAGLTYKGTVKVEGGPVQTAEEKAQLRQMGMSDMSNFEFEAQADGGRFKMTYLTAFAMFPKGTYLLGDSSTKVVWFVFPDKREYWEMNVDEMGNSGKQMMKSMKVTYSDTKVDVLPLPPKIVSGTPCAGKRIALAYTVSSSFMGMKNRSHTEETTDYYTTDKYDILALFGGVNWHQQGLVTGDEAFDKVIAAKTGFMGFPMEVRTHRVVDGKDEGTTILTTRDVSLGPILPGTFSLPTGYTKTQMGMGSMLRGLGAQPEEAQAETPQEEGAQAAGEEPESPPAGEQPKKKSRFRDLLKNLGK